MKVKTSLDVASNKITSLATPTADTDAATKAYVDSASSAGVPDADATTKGKLQLAGDLAGTAASPAIATGAITSAKIADGTITDTDVAAANKDGTAATASLRTLGTSATSACAGNDSRLSDSRAPSGSAGGDLTGTYPNPTIASGAVTSTHILNGTIVNADISASAAIVYSKLSLSGSIVNADVSASAAIATSKISGFDTQVRTSRLDQMAAPTASVSLNSQKITSLATPTASTDGATKAYVDTAAPVNPLLLIGA